MSSHIEPKVLAARERSTRPGSTLASNTVSTSRTLRGSRASWRKSVVEAAKMKMCYSSVREAIACELAPDVEAVELRHLDTVPAVPDIAWRQRMAERAVARSLVLAAQGRHLLLAGDPVAPGEVLAASPRRGPGPHAARPHDGRMGRDAVVDIGHVAVADHDYRRFRPDDRRNGSRCAAMGSGCAQRAGAGVPPSTLSRWSAGCQPGGPKM
jgi:hypothetical protein